MTRIGVFPGSFNPPTVAHLAIADSVRIRQRLDAVDFVVSIRPLGKDAVGRPTMEQRLEVLRAMSVRVGWIRIRITELQLVADIAQGYDVVVMGADKWHEIHDPAFYEGSTAARDAAIARLPPVAVAPRAGYEAPAGLAVEIDPSLLTVSSTAARAGDTAVLVPEARDFVDRRGGWH